MNPRIVLGLLIAALVVTTLLGYYGVARRVQGWMAYQDLAPQLDNESDPMRPAALARLADEDRAIPTGATILIGDSNVAHAPWHGDCLVNRGIGGERSDQLLANVADWRSLDRAEAVVIAIGTNDVWQWRAEGLEQRVAAIVQRIEAPTLLLGLSARLRGIDAANAALRRACTGRCRFIEPIDELGPDGIHLSQRGYQALAKRLALPCLTATAG